MEKKFNSMMVAVIKRTAQNVMPLQSKVDKLQAKINELQAEVDMLNTTIEQYDAPVVTMTGYKSLDLVERNIRVTKDKDGKDIKISQYVLKYPDTVVPVVEETPMEGSDDDVDSVEDVFPEVLEENNL